MAAPFPTTLTVKGLKGDSYTFRIPSLHDEFRIAARAKDIRLATDPNWDGFDGGIAYGAREGIQAAATLEVQLDSTSAKWLHVAGKDGKPVVDSAQFPADMVNEVLAVYEEYKASVARFRTTGSPDKQPDPPEAVAGERLEGDAAVQS